MKTTVDCLPCILRQALKISRLSGSDEYMQLKVIQQVAANLSLVDMGKSPAENCMYVYRLISELSGKEDPYTEIKKQLNDEVLKILPLLRKKTARAEVPLISALRLALLANHSIEAKPRLLDAEEILAKSKTITPVVDDLRSLLERLSDLAEGAKILYLANNAGEIVYDTLLVQCLVDRGFNVTVAVKESAVVSDALYGDAVDSGLDRMAQIITNGTSCSGTPLDRCSEEFLDTFHRADLVIAKGQGNFETLSHHDKEIVFIFVVKCDVVGRLLQQFVKKDEKKAYGPGDMVIFHSGERNK